MWTSSSSSARSASASTRPLGDAIPCPMVFIGHGVASPKDLVGARAARAEELDDVHILSSLTLYPYRFITDRACIGHIDYHTMFASEVDRGFVHLGTVHPVSYTHLTLPTIYS